MARSDDIREKSSALKDQMRAVHGVRGRDLAQAAGRGKRLMPRGVRKDAQDVNEAMSKLGNPKLERMLDVREVRRAQARVQKHLDGVDVADRRKGFWLSIAGSVAFNILIVGGLFLGWLVWSGTL